MSNKGFIPLILIIILAATLGIGAFLFVAFQQTVRVPVTFIVTVPKTTPADDTIVLHYNGKQLPLEKVADFTYKAVLHLFPGEKLQYGYSRGGFHPFGEKGATEGDGPRHLIVGDNKLVQDTVLEWKWLPKEPLNEQDIPSLAGKKPFKERPQFFKGVQFVDFWDASFPYQYTSTINHLKAQGYKWIIIAPPWDIKSQDPPEISNTGVKVPAYPDDKLREHIRIFKQAGFKLMLRPQICCEPISFEGRNDTWWKKWYDEVEDFVAYHADLARDEGVDAIVLGGDDGLPLDPKSPLIASERWKKIIKTAKTSKALLGYETLAWGASYEDIIPGPGELIDFFDDLDFIGVAYASVKSAGLEKGQETFYTWDDSDQIPVKYGAEEQAMIYEALMRQVVDKEYIQGIFPFGYWYLDAPLTVDMSIRAKMTERILTNWLKHIPD